MTCCSRAAEMGGEPGRAEGDKTESVGLECRCVPALTKSGSCYEKFGLTKQIDKGGVTICFTPRITRNWLIM